MKTKVQVKAQKERIRESINKRLRPLEKIRPLTEEEAIVIAKESKRLRKRLSKVVRLKYEQRPTHMIIVDVWGEKKIYAFGTVLELENMVKEDVSLRVAGYEIKPLEREVEK